MLRPQQTFIGSSTEGLVVAEAIVANLPQETNCRVWTEGIFLPGSTYIETLEKVLDEMDYAILVATPDDLLTKRDIAGFTMRDNVLLELGLFMAKLGRRRTYLVSSKDEPIHIPSDLLGLTTVSYETPKDPASWTQILAGPCRLITMAMQEAQSDLSRAMKRVVIKRLLGWITKLQEIVVALQAESFKSALDRKKFEKLRAELTRQLSDMIREYQSDAESLGVVEQYDQLARIMLRAVEAIPFPEEALVSTQDVLGGALSSLLRGKSVETQISDRVNSLSRRYDAWRDEYAPLTSQSLLNLQTALVAAL
jgi:hypothetical protein